MLGTEFQGGPGSLDLIQTQIDELIAKASQYEGWAGLEGLENPNMQADGSQQDQQSDLLAAHFLECFSTGSGQVVLKHFVDGVILMPPANINPDRTVEQHAVMAIATEAQQKLVWFIFWKMQRALEQLNTTSGGNDENIT